MNQSTAIFGAIFVAYFVFITIRGELPIYAGFLLSSPQGASTQSSNTTNAQSSNIQGSDIAGAAVTALALA